MSPQSLRIKDAVRFLTCGAGLQCGRVDLGGPVIRELQSQDAVGGPVRRKGAVENRTLNPGCAKREVQAGASVAFGLLFRSGNVVLQDGIGHGLQCAGCRAGSRITPIASRFTTIPNGEGS